MAVKDALIDVVGDEEQDTTGGPTESTTPERYSVACDVEHGIGFPSPGVQGEVNPTSELDISTSNTNPENHDENPPKFSTTFKRAFKNSIWGFLSFAPVLIAFNMILDLNKDATIIWNNFFGRFLFALSIMAACLVIWVFIYGIFVVPIGRWLFPKWFMNETVEVESEERVADDGARLS